MSERHSLLVITSNVQLHSKLSTSTIGVEDVLVFYHSTMQVRYFDLYMYTLNSKCEKNVIYFL